MGGRMLYSILNRTNERAYEQLFINGVAREIEVFPNERIVNLRAENLRLDNGSKLILTEQVEWIQPNLTDKYFEENEIKTINNVLKYKMTSPSIARKLLILPPHMEEREAMKHIQYTIQTYQSLYNHLTVDGLMIVNLIDYNDAFGRYCLMDEKQEKEFIAFVHDILADNQLNESDLIFSGGSKGASASVYLASFFKGSTVISFMPQFKYSNFFVDQAGRKAYHLMGNQESDIDFTKYIIDENKYIFYIGTQDGKSTYYQHSNILMNDYKRNVKFNLINIGHEVQVHYKYEGTYQVDKLLNQYEEVLLNNVSYDVKTVGTRLYISYTNLEKFSNRMVMMVELKYNNKQVAYHLEYNEELNLAEIIGYYNNKIDYIELKEILREEELKGEIQMQLVVKDIENKKVYRSDKFSVQLNAQLENEVQPVKGADGFELLFLYRKNHLFLFEAQTRNKITTPVLSSVILIKTKSGKQYSYPVLVQDRMYVTKFILNTRRPICIKEEIEEVELMIVDQKNVVYNYNLKEHDNQRLSDIWLK